MFENDRENLVENDAVEVRRPFFKRHSRCFCALAVFLVIAIAHIVGVKLIYFPTFTCTADNDCVPIKIMALNTWGLPATFGVKFKEERMKAIAEEFAKAEYDVYLFEELWMEGNHETIAAKTPENYTMTAFRDLALSTCDGRIAPTACSGLAVASKFPIKSKRFDSYTYHGDAAKLAIDGEWLARKGIGRVSIEPLPGVNVDVFITHTAADPDPSHGYNNSYYRVRQVKELMEDYIPKAEGDVVILGGDFNAGPDMEKGAVYEMIRRRMKNCIEEFFYKVTQWLNPNYATYGNKENTFSNQYKPIIYDYVFHETKKEKRDALNVYTDFFDLPFFKTIIQIMDKGKKEEKKISFSDHEAVTTTIYIKKLK